MRRILPLMVCLSGWAGVSEPRPGVIVTGDGAARELLGGPGSFTLGEPVATGVCAAALAGPLLVFKKDSSVTVGEHEFVAPPGGAMFGPSSIKGSAFVYLTGTKQFARASEDGLEILVIDASLAGGDVIALAGGEMLTVYVSRGGGVYAVRFRLGDGAVESDMDLQVQTSTAAALPDGTLVYAREEVLVVRNPSGDEQEVPVPGKVDAIAAMGDGWFHVDSRGRSFALGLRLNGPALFPIPEVQK